MLRTHLNSQKWVERGTDLFLAQVALLDEQALSAPSALPGWSRKHLVAHVAANAVALSNLVHWADTGERTPMYSSTEQRNADIEAGSSLTGSQLSAWLTSSAHNLAGEMSRLAAEKWRNEVVTAQGRTVPATEVPWLRAREVCVHAVDLGTGLTFADLPEQFLEALVVNVQEKRDLETVPSGGLPDVAAYLAGRPHALVDVPELGRWL
ncbi:maleylpyruvate isomerase family mycothiol-dependent enzyme [Pseudonocardia sp. NPDC049635]|uniref:maleylpyruvate isomerase family mycothiol-dependent enzyme n=1 Tax=Pseudonocardia sp. NPDC049635 TaxID=3155506 RepID=UPI0033C8405C